MIHSEHVRAALAALETVYPGLRHESEERAIEHLRKALTDGEAAPEAIPHLAALELLEIAEDVLSSATEWTPKDLLAKATRAVRKARGEEER